LQAKTAGLQSISSRLAAISPRLQAK